MSEQPEDLKETLAKILTGGVHYYELRDNLLNDGAMQPEFAARWASDVADEVDEIATAIQAMLEDIIGKDEGDFPKGILDNYWSYPSVRNRERKEARQRATKYNLTLQGKE